MKKKHHKSSINFPFREVNVSPEGETKIKEVVDILSKNRETLAIFLQGSTLRMESGPASDIDFIVIFEEVTRKIHDAIRDIFSKVPKTDFFYSSLPEYQNCPSHAKFQFFVSRQIFGKRGILGKPPSNSDLETVLNAYLFSVKDQLRPLLFRNDLNNEELMGSSYAILKRTDDCIIRVLQAIRTGTYPSKRDEISIDLTPEEKDILAVLNTWQQSGKPPQKEAVQEALQRTDELIRRLIISSE